MRRDDQTMEPVTVVPHLRAAAAVGMLYLRALKRTSPALFHFLATKRPQVRFRWGRHEMHLRRDGVVLVPRPQDDSPTPAHPRTDDHSRASEADVFLPRRPGEQDRDPYLFRTPREGRDDVEPGEPLSLHEEALRSEVLRRMGKRPEVDEEDLAIPEELRNHEALSREIARVRDLLQGLDDVEDFELIQQLSDDLYHLYRAVDYKIRLHHSSEAKVELGKLFKM